MYSIKYILFNIIYTHSINNCTLQKYKVILVTVIMHVSQVDVKAK